MGEKIFCGNGEEKFNGDLINICVDVDVMSKNFKEYGFTTSSGKRMMKLNVGKHRSGPDKYGKTHHVSVDTWKPESREQSQF